MCEVCEGKKPIPFLTDSCYCPGPIWICVKGVTDQLSDSDFDGLPQNPLPDSDWRGDWGMMADHDANVFIAGSEDNTCYKFKYCPECGRKLTEE